MSTLQAYTNGHSVDVPLVQWILTEASKHTNHQYYEPNRGKEKYKRKEAKGEGEEEGGRERGKNITFLSKNPKLSTAN